MQFNSYIWFGLLFVSLLFVSCRNEDPKETNFVFDIEDEFHLGLIESLSPEKDRQLNIGISSIREFNCKNFTINSTVEVLDGNRFRISVADLLTPEECIPGNAPAVGNIALGKLAPGAYQINVFLANEIDNKGTLIVQPDYYDILIEEENGILLPYSRLNRVPEQMVWGYVGFGSNGVEIADNLIGDMMELVEVDHSLALGNYGHFRIEENQNIILPNEDIPYSFYQTFLFRLKVPMEELRNQVDQIYCPQYGEKLDLILYASDGSRMECY